MSKLSADESKSPSATGSTHPQIVMDSRKSLRQSRPDVLQQSQLSVEERQHNAGAWSGLGSVALREGDFCKAGEYFDRALTFLPEDETLLLNRGFAFLSLAHHDDAEDCFLQILAQHPESHKGRVALAYSQLLRGNYAEALCQYRVLMRDGLDNEHLRNGMLLCAEQLQADDYLPELEADLIRLYSFSGIDHSRLANLSCSLLVHKYQLEKNNKPGSLQALCNDQLLLAALAKSRLCNPHVEAMIIELRRAILLECNSTGALQDQHIPLVYAIARQSSLNEYIFACKDDELSILLSLHKQLQLLKLAEWHTEDVIGALLLVAMYEALYYQNYAFKIARFDLQDWPAGSHAILNRAFYQYQRQAASLYCIRDKEALFKDSGIELNPNLQSPAWHHLRQEATNSFVEAMRHELFAELPQTAANEAALQVLVLGCDSGQEALRIAAQYRDVQVTAVEANACGTAYAIAKARELNIDNIQFPQQTLLEVITRHRYDLVICEQLLNHVDDVERCLRLLSTALKSRGLLKAGLNNALQRKDINKLCRFSREHALKPTEQNVIALRGAIIESHPFGEWQQILNSNWFYNGPELINTLFYDQKEFTLGDIQSLGQKLNLRFAGFCNIDHACRDAFSEEYDLPDSPLDLRSWELYDRDNPQAFSKGFQLYWQKSHLASVPLAD